MDMNKKNIRFLPHEYWSLGFYVRAVCGLRTTLRHDSLTLGKALRSFEEMLGRYLNKDYVVGVGSGSDAIYLALTALGIGRGSEVIAPANVCVAVVESVLRTGATLHFVDIDHDKYTINPRLVERAIGPRTKAVLCVHAYGLPADMGDLLSIGRRNDLYVVELCGQAFGATLNGLPVGSFGDVACFSFNPSKVLGGVGDGGAVATNNREVAERVRYLANHGRAFVGADAEYIGISSRLDTFNAQILTQKLGRIDRELKMRRESARYYRELVSSRFKVQMFPEGYCSSVQFFVLETPHRDRVRAILKEKGIETRIHYPLPYEMPAYRGHKQLKGIDSLPVTEEVAQRIMTLPFHNRFRRRDADYVAKCLFAALDEVSEVGQRSGVTNTEVQGEPLCRTRDEGGCI